MSNVKFTQLPNQGALTDATIVPTVASGVNYTVTGANLKTYVNSTTGNVTAGNLLTGGQVTAAGNITGAYILGNGSLLTGLPATYGNANVSNYLASGTNGANIVTQANVAGAYVIADGSALTNLTGAAISGTISVAGNITGAYLKGNISGATGGYGNANVQLVLQTYSGTLTAATVSATGNIAGAYFSGNGSQLTGITATLGGTMVSNIAGAGYSITGLGQLSATGNILGANITGTHYGSGSNLTGIPTSIIAGTGISVNAATGAVTITNNNPTPYTNTNVTSLLAAFGSNTISTTGSVTAGSVTASGNITGTHLGNGAGLSNIVTSIAAGSGISVNASTGAVTITATGGGGGGTSISNGASNVTIATSNGNITTGLSGWGNVVNIYSFLSTYPVHYHKGFLYVESTTGQYDTGNTYNGGIECRGDLASLEGNLLIGKNATITGAFTSSGAAAFNGPVALNNSTSLNGGATVASGATFSVPSGAVFNQAPRTKTGATTGTAGDIAWDANYIYVCTATNTWKRVALTAF